MIFFNKKNGDQIKKIPTETSKINGKFINYINHDNENIYFLNTFGSLYSINKDLNINWFLNLNKAVETNANNIFYSNDVLVNNNQVYVLTNEEFYIINNKNGFIEYKNNFSSNLSPVIYGDYIFLLNENNFLILIDSKSKEIIYSLDLNSELRDIISKKDLNLTL